jgi:hypothetical protein
MISTGTVTTYRAGLFKKKIVLIIRKKQAVTTISPTRAMNVTGKKIA